METDTQNRKKAQGHSIVVWQDGNVVPLDPEDIPVED